MSPPGKVLFRADNLSKFFGGVRAVDGVSFEVREGERRRQVDHLQPDLALL